jgi:hypothetical protein
MLSDVSSVSAPAPPLPPTADAVMPPTRAPAKKKSSKMSPPKTTSRSSTGGCKCTKSCCLKMYCECFRAGKACDDSICKCSKCQNGQGREQEMKWQNAEKKRKIKMSAPSAGCNCKSSECLKKYCVCYRDGRKCDETCKCMNCKNDGEYVAQGTAISPVKTEPASWWR